MRLTKAYFAEWQVLALLMIVPFCWLGPFALIAGPCAVWAIGGVIYFFEVIVPQLFGRLRAFVATNKNRRVNAIAGTLSLLLTALIFAVWRDSQDVPVSFAAIGSFTIGLCFMPLIIVPVTFVDFVAAAVLSTVVVAPLQFVGLLKTPGQEEAAQRRAEQDRNARLQAQQATGQRRREDARLRCEMHYRRHAVELRERFPEQAFDEFVSQYMGDTFSADQVEARARDLIGMIDDHVKVTKPAKKFESLDDVANWFVEEKERIQNLPVDAAAKKKHLVQLNHRYAELSDRVMEGMEP